MRAQRRPFLLLEILIAFFLVMLCLLPMIHPHLIMLRAERGFIREIELDQAVNIIHANLLQKFYEGKIPWSAVSTLAHPLEPQPITDEAFQRLGYPENYLQSVGFSGTYRIRIKTRANTDKIELSKTKGKDGQPINHLLRIEYSFTPLPGFIVEPTVLKEPRTYTYGYDLYVQTPDPKP